MDNYERTKAEEHTHIQVPSTGAGVVDKLMENREENAAHCCSCSQVIFIYNNVLSLRSSGIHVPGESHMGYHTIPFFQLITSRARKEALTILETPATWKRI